MARIAFIVVYLASAAAAVVLLNANIGHGELAIAIWAVASVLLAADAGGSPPSPSYCRAASHLGLRRPLHPSAP